MIKTLRKKFILIAMGSLVLIMLILLGGLNIANIYQTNRETDQMLRFLADNGGTFKTSPPDSGGPGASNSDGSASSGKNGGASGGATGGSGGSASDNSGGSATGGSSGSATGGSGGSSDKSGDSGGPGASSSGSSMQSVFSSIFHDSIAPPDGGSGGGHTPYLTKETEFETRFFAVTVSADGTITDTNTDSIAAVTQEEADAYATQILSGSKTSGTIGGIYKYLVTTDDDGSRIIVFLDCENDIRSAEKLLITSVIIALVSFLAMFLLVTVLSKKAIAPVIESMSRQQQFISDAGHELKTPLAIISANCDVLNLTGEDNEWVQSIQSQTKRMSRLVQELLRLAKLDTGKRKLESLDFSLSDAVADTAQPFQVLAENQGKSVVFDIKPDLHYTGDEYSIRELVSILTDNAVKYAADGGQIRVGLDRSGKRLALTVSNPCEEVPKDKLNRLFDRFYRVDPSRARETGGYGIGLSIAREIVEEHKGRISAAWKDGKMIFTILL